MSHICHWYLCTEFSSYCISNSITKLIPKDEKIWCGENAYGAQHMDLHGGPQQTNCFSNTQQPKHTHTQPTKQKITYNTITMVPQVVGFQRLQFYRWVQLPYIAWLITIIATQWWTFNDDTNFSFIYLTNILCAAAQRAHQLKVSF